MNADEYARMAAQEESGWWFVAKRLFVHRLLAIHKRFDGPLLDAGCGTGAVIRSFETVDGAPGSVDPPLFGLDPSTQAVTIARNKCRANLLIASVDALPLAEKSFQTALLLDVLEHLDDDIGALRELHRVLRPGGILVASVPAFPWLFGEHDEALHHRRRYYKCQFEERLRAAGFQLVYVGYAFTLLFPLAVLSRTWGRFHRRSNPRADVGHLPPLLNSVLCAVMRLEAGLWPCVRAPWGTTLIALARRE